MSSSFSKMTYKGVQYVPLSEAQAEIERLQDALRLIYTWNASGDYQRDLFRMKDFAIAALDGEK